MKFNLFLKRNCDGSDREYTLFEDLMDTISSSNYLISDDCPFTKDLMINLDFIVKGINDLQKRTYVFI